MNKVIFIFLMIAFCNAYSQKRKDIKENVTDFYTKNDSLPFLKFERQELDTFIDVVFVKPLVADFIGIKFKDVVGFKIDNNGKMNSIIHYKPEVILPDGKQFMNFEDEKRMYLDYKKELERVLILSESLWFTDSIRSKNEVVIKLIVNPKEIKKEKNNNVVFVSGSINHDEKYNVGVKKFTLRKTLLAKVYFEQVIKENKKDIDAYYNLAACCVKLKENSKACEYFKKCAELGDNSVNEQINRYCK